MDKFSILLFATSPVIRTRSKLGIVVVASFLQYMHIYSRIRTSYLCIYVCTHLYNCTDYITCRVLECAYFSRINYSLSRVCLFYLRIF